MIPLENFSSSTQKNRSHCLNSAIAMSPTIDMNPETLLTPPEFGESDYIELFLLIFMVAVGGPLNLLSLFRSLKLRFADFLSILLEIARLFRNRSRVGRPSPTLPPSRNKFWKRPLTLRFHLTVANLLVIWVYGLSEIFWLITYTWNGGNVLCKSIRFLHAFCFYATSNLVVVIGLDRLHVTVYVDRPRSSRRNKATPHVRWLASVAWTLAFVSSVPQLFIWGTFEPFPRWEQCVTIWTVKKYDHVLRNNDTTEDQLRLYYEEKIYDAVHLALVFWIPAIFITVSYICIVTRFNFNIRKTSRSPVAPIAPPINAEKRRWSFSGPGNNQFLKSAFAPSDFLFSIKVVNSPAASSFEASPPHFSPVVRKSNSCTGHRFFKSLSPTVDQNQLEWRPEPEPSSSSPRPQGNKILTHKDALRTSSCSFALITLKRAKRRTVRKTIWILLAYFIFWSPYNLLALLRYFHAIFEHAYLEIMYNLIVLNAVVNPLIYGI